MTAKDVLQTVAQMPQEEWMKIQRGLAEMICAQFTSGEVAEIRQALSELRPSLIAARARPGSGRGGGSGLREDPLLAPQPS